LVKLFKRDQDIDRRRTEDNILLSFKVTSHLIVYNMN